MADSDETRGVKVFNEAGARLEMVVRGVHDRQVADVQGVASVPPPSTVYVHTDEVRDNRFMYDPAGAWMRSPLAPLPAENPPAGRNWRRYMPWPVRWVMGWP